MANGKIQMETGKSKLENGGLAQTSDVCGFSQFPVSTFHLPLFPFAI
jgi:hypothetical protein